MNRFNTLLKEINKGIDIEEKSGVLIKDWSPNNLRRLIIGFDFCLVNYFVTYGRYKRLFELVDLRREAERDLELLNYKINSYKGLLNVLVHGRVCSSVEEIVFCSVGYPNEALNLDLDFDALRGRSSIESRFPRLRHISIVSVDVRTLYEEVKEHIKGNLIHDILLSKGIQFNKVLDQHETDWWRGTFLRPKYYEMDAGVLEKYFEKIRIEYESREKESKLREIERERVLGYLSKNEKALIALLNMSFSLIDKGNGVFDKVSIISKAEWANVLYWKNVCRVFKKELENRPDFWNSVRGIDFNRVKDILQDMGYVDFVGVIEKLEEVMDEVLKGDEYKRESNKLGFIDSMDMIQKVGVIFFNTIVNASYLALVKFLSRNSLEYVDHFKSRLKGDLTGLRYTRNIVEFCNKKTEVGIAKSVFDKLNAEEVLVDNFSILDRYKEAKRVLDALS